jgi:glutamine amidotransferase PdxT
MARASQENFELIVGPRGLEPRTSPLSGALRPSDINEKEPLEEPSQSIFPGSIATTFEQLGLYQIIPRQVPNAMMVNGTCGGIVIGDNDIEQLV